MGPGELGPDAAARASREPAIPGASPDQRDGMAQEGGEAPVQHGRKGTDQVDRRRRRKPGGDARQPFQGGRTQRERILVGTGRDGEIAPSKTGNVDRAALESGHLTTPS